jgi:hypothetical protein
MSYSKICERERKMLLFVDRGKLEWFSFLFLILRFWTHFLVGKHMGLDVGQKGTKSKSALTI